MNDNKVHCADWEKLVDMWNMLELEAESEDDEPCGKCDYCLRAESAAHPYLKVVVDNT